MKISISRVCVDQQQKQRIIFSSHRIKAAWEAPAHTVSYIHLLHECKQSRNISGLSCSLHCRCLGQATVRVDRPVPSQSHADHAPVVHCRHCLCSRTSSSDFINNKFQCKIYHVARLVVYRLWSGTVLGGHSVSIGQQVTHDAPLPDALATIFRALKMQTNTKVI